MRSATLLILAVLVGLAAAGFSRCPRHSSPSQCGNACEPRCGDKEPRICPLVCGPPACVCDRGFVRDSKGRCIPKRSCPKPKPQCPKNSVINGCGNLCERRCDSQWPRPCPKICKPAACVCKEGYARNEKGKCVKAKHCPKKRQNKSYGYGYSKRHHRISGYPPRQPGPPTWSQPQPEPSWPRHPEHSWNDKHDNSWQKPPSWQQEEPVWKKPDHSWGQPEPSWRDREQEKPWGPKPDRQWPAPDGPHWEHQKPHHPGHQWPKPDAPWEKPRDPEAPRRCGRNESINQCGNRCEPRCGDVEPKVCILICDPPACHCDEGFVRDNNGDCVPKWRCPRE